MSDLRRPQRAAAGEDVIFSRLLKARGRGQVSGTAAPFLPSHVPVGPTRGGIQLYQLPGVPTFVPMILAGITWVALKGSVNNINGKTVGNCNFSIQNPYRITLTYTAHELTCFTDAVTSCCIRDIMKGLLNGDVRAFDILASRLGTI